jgi:hypothetical protein
VHAPDIRLALDTEHVWPPADRGPHISHARLSVRPTALPWLGFVPDDVKAAPTAAVTRIATQLGVETGALRFYAGDERDTPKRAVDLRSFRDRRSRL